MDPGSHHVNHSAAPQVTPKRVGADNTTGCCQGAGGTYENPRAVRTVAVEVQRRFLKHEPCTSILLGGEGSRPKMMLVRDKWWIDHHELAIDT